MSDSAGWMESIRKSGEESRRKEAEHNARLDKIIAELDAYHKLWWMDYREAVSIARAMLDCHESTSDLYILEQKRRIVAQVILPSVGACIRAGYVRES